MAPVNAVNATSFRGHSQGKRYFDCRETFRHSAPGNPEAPEAEWWNNYKHRRKSPPPSLFSPCSHDSLRPSVRSFVRPSSTPFARCQSTLHRAQRVFCHHRNYISPFNRFFDRRRRENINTVVERILRMDRCWRRRFESMMKWILIGSWINFNSRSLKYFRSFFFLSLKLTNVY